MKNILFFLTMIVTTVLTMFCSRNFRIQYLILLASHAIIFSFDRDRKVKLRDQTVIESHLKKNLMTVFAMLLLGSYPYRL